MRPGQGATFQTLALEHGPGDEGIEAHLHIVPAPDPASRLQFESGRIEGTITNRTTKPLRSVYVRSWSLLWDLRIIKDTPRSVLAGRGAY